MAIVLIQAPSVNTLALSRSPIIITLQEQSGPSVTNRTYRYVVRIRFRLEGAIATVPALPSSIELLAFPNIDLYGVFDVSEFLNDQFLPDRPNIATGTETKVGVMGVSVEYGFYLDGAYTKEGDVDTFFVTPGYSAVQSDINTYENRPAINNAEAFLSPQSTVIVSNLSDASAVHVFRGFEQGRKVVIVDDQGTSFDVSLTGTPSDVEDVILRIPTGKDELDTLSGGTLAPVNSCTFTLAVDDGGPTVFETITASYLNADFCDIESDVMCYINRYGVWDYLSMRGRASEQISQSRTTFDRRVAVNSSIRGRLEIPKGISEKGTVAVIGGKSITLNTGFVKNEQNKQVQDLLLSRQHFSFVENQNVLIKTSGLAIRKESDKNLVNYELEFELAGNLIQNIK